MTDYSWVDINSTGLRKAICMIAEKYSEGKMVTDEEVGRILHKTTQRSGLKNAPIMLNAINEMGRTFDKNLKMFCKILEKTKTGEASYKYDALTNCAVVDDKVCIGISNQIPTPTDFESMNGSGNFELYTVLNLSDGKMYRKPILS